MDEIDSIRYSALFQMTHDAFVAIFAADDDALELRFLPDFALKSADDPFYLVPVDEATADAYFTVREERFQRWIEQIAPHDAKAVVGQADVRGEMLLRIQPVWLRRHIVGVIGKVARCDRRFAGRYR